MEIMIGQVKVTFNVSAIMSSVQMVIPMTNGNIEINMKHIGTDIIPKSFELNVKVNEKPKPSSVG